MSPREPRSAACFATLSEHALTCVKASASGDWPAKLPAARKSSGRVHLLDHRGDQEWTAGPSLARNGQLWPQETFSAHFPLAHSPSVPLLAARLHPRRQRTTTMMRRALLTTTALLLCFAVAGKSGLALQGAGTCVARLT